MRASSSLSERGQLIEAEMDSAVDACVVEEPRPGYPGCDGRPQTEAFCAVVRRLAEGSRTGSYANCEAALILPIVRSPTLTTMT